MEDCLFCKIVRGEVAATKRFEDGQFLAFEDIHPESPIHILVIPKHHITSLAHATSMDAPLLGDLLICAAQIAQNLGLKGFKVRINTGRDGGQVIDHLHIHVQGDVTAK
jgi:histidine triad (HIT) family protein